MTVRSAYQGKLTVDAQPRSVLSSQQVILPTRLFNRGLAPWSSKTTPACFISYRWLDTSGALVTYEGIRTPLPQPVAPGQELSCDVYVATPSAPGSYRLEIDVVVEHVAWLGAGPSWHVSVSELAHGRRITLFAPCWQPRDAIGNQLLHKMRAILAWGDPPLLILNDPPEQFPAELRPYCVVANADQIFGQDSHRFSAWIGQHLRRSEIAVYEYPIYYPLMDTIRHCPARAIVFDYHGVTPPSLWGTRTAQAEIEQGQRRIDLVAYADLGLAHSPFTRSELVATGLIEPERVLLMPYPVEQQRADASATLPNIRERHRLGMGPLLLYVGRLAHSKRIDILIASVARLRSTHPSVRLVIVGDDRSPLYRNIIDELRDQVAALGLTEMVIFAGPVADEELPAYYNACDLYVTSSLHEGFCIPVIEAMSCGKPVVASDATALPWTVGSAGITFQAGDVDACVGAIRRVLDSCCA